jgi:Co/Zn/Cd efflux system component
MVGVILLALGAVFAEYHRLISPPQVEADSTLVVGILDGFLTKQTHFLLPNLG